MENQDKFFNEGMKANIIGIHKSLNPNRRGIEEYYFWDDGWDFADKLERYAVLKEN